MFDKHHKHPVIKDNSFDINDSFSYINLIQQQSSRIIKPSHLKVRSNVNSSTKNRQKNHSRKHKEKINLTRSPTLNKDKQENKSTSKSKKTIKKGISKLLTQKRQYKTTQEKPSLTKIKSKRTQKMTHNKRISLDSMFKKQEVVYKKKKSKEDKIQKGQKKIKTQKSKQKTKYRLQKSKSQSAMDQITLSEIKKEEKFGNKQSKVIHQYFGMEDKLSSILEEKQKEQKFKSSKTRIEKSKTRSSVSSLSQRKGSKFKLKSGKKG